MNRIFLTLLFSGYVWVGALGLERVAIAQTAHGCLFRGDWPSQLPTCETGFSESPTPPWFSDGSQTTLGNAAEGPAGLTSTFRAAQGAKCWLCGQESLVRSLTLQERLERQVADRLGIDTWLEAGWKPAGRVWQGLATVHAIANQLTEEVRSGWERALCIRAAQIAAENEFRWEMYWAYYEACDCWLPGYWESLSEEEQWRFLQPSFGERLLGRVVTDLPAWLGSHVCESGEKAGELADWTVIRMNLVFEKISYWQFARNWQRTQEQWQKLLGNWSDTLLTPGGRRQARSVDSGMIESSRILKMAAESTEAWAGAVGKRAKKFTSAVASGVQAAMGATLEVLSRFPVEAIGRVHPD